MKKQSLITILTVVALSCWLAGCKEKSDTVSEPVEKAAEESENVVGKATDAVKDTVQAAKETGAKVVEDVKQAGETAVNTVTEKAKEMAAPVNAEGQKLIDSAKSLFSEGKLSDALAKLKDASGLSLSEEQKKTVDTLKAQIEKALATTSDATKSASDAVNNLLKK